MKKSLFLLPILIVPSIAHAAELCSSSNPCQNFNRTINGSLYCWTGGTCTAGIGGSQSGTGYLLSKYCKNNKGDASSDATCSPLTCASGYVFDNTSNSCVQPVCGPGYTGTATGTNNQGCTACNNKPNNSVYTTNNSCNWACVNYYYKSGSTCVMCPSSNLSGIYTSNNLLANRPGETGGTGAISVTECYLPAATYYSANGTFEVVSGYKCQYKN